MSPSFISTSTFEDKAISFKLVDRPPRVGSLRTWISLLTFNISATKEERGAVSLFISVSNFKPSLSDKTAIPWLPMGPFIITTSPILALLPEILTPSSTIPIPVVLINILSAAPLFTTLVSPVTISTLAIADASFILKTIFFNKLKSIPSSIIKEQLKYKGVAPHIAKSLTVP